MVFELAGILLASIPSGFTPQTCSEITQEYCIDQPLIPVVKVGNNCPIGFSSSNGYCIPNNSKIRGVIPIFNGLLPESCPIGYRINNGYCQTTKNLKTNYIPLIGKSCPRKYFKRGNYCTKPCTKIK